ncbi:MAG: amidohydrolase family protein [Firmicutes bacterium]|nr:amidohydrolase family protein [Bacillota bacterium]
MEDIYLSEFQPRSELVVPVHEVPKPRFPVIDFHTHFGVGGRTYDLDEAMKGLDQAGVKAVVNLDGFWGERLDQVLEYTKDYSHRMVTFGNVDISRLDDPDWPEYVAGTLRRSYEKGIRGIKFFKSLSLEEKDKSGNYIPADDDRLQPIWDTAAELCIPVLIHIADPIAFFRPVDGTNERFEELSLRPEWSFYKEGLFTYEELMEQQQNLLAKNPDTIFVIAHVGSAAENLGWVAEQLDRFPNMYVDMAARLAELGRQPYTAREFLIKYQDRFLFATDLFPGGHTIYPYYYRFLETKDEYFDYAPVCRQGRWKIYGVDLPDEVLEKIYYRNAIKLVPELEPMIAAD